MSMKCLNPFIGSGGRAYGCGQCMPCRFNRRRIWSHRMLLEAAQYSDNSFWTLTYNDESLPLSDSGLPEVRTGDLQLFLKRLRWSHPIQFRFFGVGEYGDVTSRPHYHLALFNYPQCLHGMSVYDKTRTACCSSCDQVRDCWGKGNVFGGSLEAFSAQYIAGYVTKKMTKKDDPRLLGRAPEFARMSRRPGIGVSAMWEVADTIMKYGLDPLDVPVALRHGKKELPLGRFLRRKLRGMIGRDEKAPEEAVKAAFAELQPVYEAALLAAPRNLAARNLIYKNTLVDVNERVEEGRSRKRAIFSRERKL